MIPKKITKIQNKTKKKNRTNRVAKITKIEEQKNKKRVNIFVDDAFFCGLNKESAILFGIKVGTQVNEEKLKSAAFDSDVKSAFDKACTLLSSRSYTKKEILDKMRQKGYDENASQAAIKKLEEYGYINDSAYAREYVRCYQNLSKMAVKNKLLAKGVAKDIINEVLADKNTESEFQSAVVEANKYCRGKDKSKPDFKQKLFASLARKGFEFDVIKKAVGEIIKNSDFDEFTE